MATTRKSASTTAPAPAAPDTNGANPYADLAAGAREVSSLPQRARGASVSPLAELVARSYAEGQAFELPPISTDEKEVARVVGALRRAAQSKELGVSIVHEVRDGQTVVTFQGKDRRV